ncbi:hypothetical protein HDU98_009042 [Podochytrium sp. JEL0797]|nr:hypothetical protein HDU98_009042 [Podochytrium sp. JEL0797]
MSDQEQAVLPPTPAPATTANATTTPLETLPTSTDATATTSTETEQDQDPTPPPPPPPRAPKNWPSSIKFTIDYILPEALQITAGLPAVSEAQIERSQLLTLTPKPYASPHAIIEKITDPKHPAFGEFGLFALRDMCWNTHIVDYVGEVISADDPKCQTSDYVLDFGGGGEGCFATREDGTDLRLSIDGSLAGNEGRMVNDFRGVPFVPDYTKKSKQSKKPANPEYAMFSNKSKPNVEFRSYVSRADSGELRMGLFAIERIQAGRELLVSYGKGYWASRGVDMGEIDLDASDPLSRLRQFVIASPTHAAAFLGSLKHTLETLPPAPDTTAPSHSDKLRSALIECLGGTRGTAPETETQVGSSQTLAEIVSLLSVWCEMKGRGLSVEEFGDRAGEFPAEWKYSSAFRTLAVSRTEEAFLFNAGLVVVAVLQAETNSLGAFVANGTDFTPEPNQQITFEYAKTRIFEYLKTAMFWRTVMIGLTLLTIGWGMAFVQMWSDDQILDAANGAPLIPLNDTFYDVFIPEPFKHFSDGVVNIPIVIVIIGTLVFSAVMNANRSGDPLKKIRRSIFVLSLVYACRMISIASTRLPPVNPSFCQHTPSSGFELFTTSFAVLTTSINSCTDMMFSGHTAILSVFITRLWFDLKPLPRRIKLAVRFLAVCLFLFSIGVFVAVKLHYSMDIWIGLLIGYSWSIGIEVAFEFRSVFRQSSWHVSLMKWVDCVDGWKKTKKSKKANYGGLSMKG